MAGFATDTKIVEFRIPLDDGTTILITGENDGVNGMAYTADRLIPWGTNQQLDVEVTEQTLTDGITDEIGDKLDALRERGTCSHCLARTYRGEECVCPEGKGDAEDVRDEFDQIQGER